MEANLPLLKFSLTSMSTRIPSSILRLFAQFRVGGEPGKPFMSELLWDIKRKMLLFKYPNFLLTFSKIQEMISRCLFTTNEIFRVPTFLNWQNSRISPGIFSLLAQLFHERLAYVIIIPPNETWSLMSLTMWMMHYERHWQDLANFHEIL